MNRIFGNTGFNTTKATKKIGTVPTTTPILTTINIAKRKTGIKEIIRTEMTRPNIENPHTMIINTISTKNTTGTSITTTENIDKNRKAMRIGTSARVNKSIKSRKEMIMGKISQKSILEEKFPPVLVAHRGTRANKYKNRICQKRVLPKLHPNNPFKNKIPFP
jgi:hypothetical protein